MRKQSNSNLLIRIGLFLVLFALLVRFAIYVGIAVAFFLAFKIIFLK